MSPARPFPVPARRSARPLPGKYPGHPVRPESAPVRGL